MPPAVQRYEVSQIFAEVRAMGLPMDLACLAAARWFDLNGIAPPASLLGWFAEVASEAWRPAQVH